MPASTRLAVADDEDLVAGDLDLVVEQRLDEDGERSGRRAPPPAFSAAMRASFSPAAIASACVGVSATAPRGQQRQEQSHSDEKRKDANVSS